MSKRFTTAPKVEEPKPKKQKKNVFGTILLILQFVLTITVMVLMGAMKILPGRLFWAACCGMGILFFLGILLQIPKVTRIFGKVAAIIVILLLGVGAGYLWKTNQALDDVFGKKTEAKANISVVVLQDSLYESLSDLGGRRVALQNVMDKDAMEETFKVLNQDLEVPAEALYYGSYMEAAAAMYNGEADAILLNEAHREMLLEAYPNFSKETKVLHTATIKKETKPEKETESKEQVDVANETFTVYLSGNDSYGEVTYEGGRSDVNILLTINPTTGQIVMTSTPRDFYVTLPEEEFGYGQRDKLTHAGIFGIDVSEQILSDLYEVPIDYYVRINFGGFEDIVNALGGVTVYSEYTFTTAGGLYTFYEGDNYVDGASALAFVRERMAFPDGDIQRGRNQMAMIKAIINKVTSPAILTSYGSLMDSLSSCFITDLPKEKLGDLVDLQLSQGIDWHIVSNDVTGYGDMMPCYTSGYSIDLSVLWPNEDTMEEAKQRIKDCYNDVVFD